MSNDVTVILNGYKRKENLDIQIKAIHNQTVSPKDILFWSNFPDDSNLINFDVARQCKSSLCNHNFGVWARFAFALMAKTEYICIFDDDTIPGKKWLENCLNTIKTHDGLLGTIGVKFFDENNYMLHQRTGWDNPNENTEVVDIVGHSWFFKREDLATYWRELPDINHSPFVGEDMHFSYTLQKFTNKKTYVPPHPTNDREMWGSNPEIAWGVGTDANAISTKQENIDNFSVALRNYVSKGFRISRGL
jgi:hypothetical protein